MATGDQQITESSQAWTESPYKFSQPVRLFKANDPYYWEVDNLPLQQLEENILWLKDQIATSTFVSGVGRSDLAELRPFANGASRTVYVQPGRYTARINDAYNKGIGTMSMAQRAVLDTLEKAVVRFSYSEEELKAILGDSVDTVFLNNGLYDHLQHHNAEATTPNGFLLDWRHGYSYYTENNKGINVIQNVPKNKLAVWKTSGDSNLLDLQQLATEFTRYYGGAVRTSVVNIPEQLSINVPEFDPADHRSSTDFQPQVRVDLLFVYSHPIDASSTTIPSPNGTVPTEIFAPRLGLLQGAGVVNVSAITGTIVDLVSSGYVDSGSFDNVKNNTDFRLDMGEGFEDSSQFKINAVAADNLQTLAGINNVYGSFPSPDDVMNLAPLFAERVEDGDNGYNLVGQSILPLAYIFTKRGKALIEPKDVVDIRPFFRTTELAYNERAGIAAANPPLSFANPAVGKRELRDVSYKAQRDMVNRTTPLIGDVNRLKTYGQTLAKGMIFGGTKWGVEGGHLAFMQRAGLFPTQTPQEALDGLKQFSHVPTDVASLPLYPGWDINTGQLDGAPGGGFGSRRNDRLFSSVIWGDNGTWQRVTPPDQLPESIYEDVNDGYTDPRLWAMQGNYTQYSGSTFNAFELLTHGCLFVKKDINFPAGFLDGFSDYDVDARMIGGVIMQNPTSVGTINNIGAGWSGLSVQKRGRNGITIIVALGHPSGSDNNPWFGRPDDWGRSVTTNTGEGPRLTFTAEDFVRDAPTFSRVMPLLKEVETVGLQHKSVGTDSRGEGGRNYNLQKSYLQNWEVYNPMLVTYPTVEFTIKGYQGVEQTTNFFSTVPTNSSTTTLNMPNFNA
jgi:hypothetical protein